MGVTVYVLRIFQYKTLSITKQETRRHNAKRVRARRRFIHQVGKCQRCGKKKNLTIDHIIPESKGGSRLSKSNWQVLCRYCNGYKGDMIIPWLKGERSLKNETHSP